MPRTLTRCPSCASTPPDAKTTSLGLEAAECEPQPNARSSVTIATRAGRDALDMTPSSHSRWRDARSASYMLRMRPAPTTLVLVASLASSVVLFADRARAADYFVATSGDDTHAGTSASPFQTIGHCASVAKAGDTCRIAAGN